MPEPAAAIELDQLSELLVAPCRLGPYQVTGRLAKSSTALVITAVGGAFGAREGVLKVTGSHHAARLAHELALLTRCADAGVRGVVRPVAPELDWLTVPGMLDAHVACLALPFLSGGNLLNLRHAVSPEARDVGAAARTIEVARTVGTTLRHLLDLERPLTHGQLSGRCVLLPLPRAPLAELTLLDFDAARDLIACSSPEIDALCRADVAAFGSLLGAFHGDAAASRQLRAFIADCRAAHFSSLADRHLWRALQGASRAERIGDV